jgi:hypothetical protein
MLVAAGVVTGRPRDTRGNHVPDAHLATLMRRYGVTVIYTRDREFRRYEGIESRHPFRDGCCRRRVGLSWARWALGATLLVGDRAPRESRIDRCALKHERVGLLARHPAV